MTNRHNADGQYHLLRGGTDHFPDEEVERIFAVHGESGVVGTCEGCGKTVHTGDYGYNEQVRGYVRYGPFFVCGACLGEAFDLPEIPYGEHQWWENPDEWLPDGYGDDS